MKYWWNCLSIHVLKYQLLISVWKQPFHFPSLHFKAQVFAYLVHPFLHSPMPFPFSLCCDLITRLTGGQVTSPPSVLLCSFSSLWFFLHLHPFPSSPLSLFSTALPFLFSCIPSCHKTLSDLPGYHHGNLHPLLDPLGDPVRSPVGHLRAEETVKCYLSSGDPSAGVDHSFWTFTMFIQLQTSIINWFSVGLWGSGDITVTLFTKKWAAV